MDKLISIAKQYNNSGRDNKVLNELRKQFTLEGSLVITLNDQDFIIQKCPDLFYKLLNLTRLQAKLNTILANSPTVLMQLTINKLLEDELVQTNIRYSN